MRGGDGRGLGRAELSLRRGRCRSLIRCLTWRVWHYPRGSYRNQDFFGPRVTADDDLEPGMLDALYDPQTSGGLLIAAPAADVDELARRLHAEGRVGPPQSAAVCEPVPGGPAVRVVR